MSSGIKVITGFDHLHVLINFFAWHLPKLTYNKVFATLFDVYGQCAIIFTIWESDQKSLERRWPASMKRETGVSIVILPKFSSTKRASFKRMTTLVLKLNETVYALDSTTIDLCLSLFPWARFRKSKGAVKMHNLLDLNGNIPSFVAITDGKVHDVNILDALNPEPGSI